MRISSVDSLDQLDPLEDEWNAVYSADEHAHIFLSWPWLRLWFANSPGRPIVLVARPAEGQPAVAFCPLARSARRRRRVAVLRTLALGGKPFADYTGFLCAPGNGTAPISAFARYIQTALRWDHFNLIDVSDPRLNHFVRCFPSNGYRLNHAGCTPSFRMTLPGSWELFLRSRLNRRARYHLNKSLRAMEALPGYRLTAATSDNWEAQVETLLRLQQSRHGAAPPGTLRRYWKIFENALHCGQLWLKIAWLGDAPLAGLAAFVDRRKREFYCYMTAFNREYERISPGKALFGHAIRESIAEGYEIFDLLRGGENYKHSRLGAREQMLTTVSVARHASLLDRLATQPQRLAFSPQIDKIPLEREFAPRRNDPRSADLLAGDRVRVRDVEQIERTLDESRALAGCRFTSSMERFCGQEMTVLKMAAHCFDEARNMTRACGGVYLLEEATCDGSPFQAAGGCDRSCLQFWRVEWLERVSSPAQMPETRETQRASPVSTASGKASPVFSGPADCQLRAGGAGGREPLRWRALRAGRAVRRSMLRHAARLSRRAHWLFFRTGKWVIRLVWPSLRRSREGGELARPSSETYPASAAHFVPCGVFATGTVVRVRSWAEIERTLDSRGSTHGCSFMRSMQSHCGHQYRVARRVRRFFDETSGRLRRCHDVYTLEGLRCNGSGGPAELGCDRCCYIFWRAEWLEPASADTLADS